MRLDSGYSCGYRSREGCGNAKKKKIVKTFMEKATPEEIKEVFDSDVEVEE